jgi:hypothetical protein
MACVDELARECVEPMVRLRGFKESHAMQLVCDAEYLNAGAVRWEAAAGAGAGAAAATAAGGDEPTPPDERDGSAGTLLF